jgi:hypothetical protein
MRRNDWRAAATVLALASLGGCGGAARVSLEVFVVSSSTGSRTIRYAKRVSSLSKRTADPDAAARELASGIATPAILHSTSWRWEKDGTVVLTYMAYCEHAEFRGVEPVQLPWDQLEAPRATDPRHPRPAEIREEDVVSHGLRHLSFLVRYALDGRLAAGLSPESRAFFRAMCGQLAGRLEAAREFEECAAAGAR